MSYWTKLIIDDVNLSLTHLEPFSFECLARDGAAPAAISVRFNDHCFTKALDPEQHSPEDLIRPSYAARTERRVFCRIRYELSFRLPDIIRTLGSKRIASTREGNLVRLELDNGETYAVFFTLRRKGRDHADLFVVSAYPLAPGKKPADTGDMKFDLALAKILRGEKAKFPPRR
ncbi:hypothetical protein [Asticcacaulis sp. YBE204]|uniref:hypothetical protein n=1 Tax=Asticcacaulis sp. YBE204 TaxID=1282363 RepID=UPI0003C3E3B7|nr:hypothetical protein [Asticcacaulis sp. YBE204]ESQ81033.1 hypothetical protein AEYBE204_01525 [Asticcacaulis sp. YBE204]